MGYILAVIRIIILVVTMALYLSVYMISTIVIKHTPERAFNLRRAWLKLCIVVLGLKIEHQGGKMIEGSALYVGNHKSFSDPVVASLYIDSFVIAKAEVANIPILKQGANLTGVIFVKRESLKSRANTRQAYLDTVKGGYNVFVYPEGTTSSDVKTLPFKKGTFKVAANEDFAVVPTAISYKSPRDLWSSGGLMKQYFRQFSKWRTHVKFWIGEPLRSEDGQALAEEAQQLIDDKLAEMDKEWKG